MRSKTTFFVTVAVMAVCLLTPGGASRAEDFIRADVDSDGVVSLADIVYLGRFFFYGGRPPACMKSADADDNGELSLRDSIHITNFLILGASAPPAPFPDPGTDPTEDLLPCESYGGGQGPLDDPAAGITVLDATAVGGDDSLATITVAISSSIPVAAVFGAIRIDTDVVYSVVDRPVDLTGISDGRGFTNAGVVGDELRFGASSAIDGDPALAFPAGEDTALLEINVCLKEGATAGGSPLTLVRGELVDADSLRRIELATGAATLTLASDIAEGAGCRSFPPVDPPENPGDIDAMYKVGDGAGVPGGTVDLPLILGANGVIQGFSFSADFDEDVLQANSIDPVYKLPSGEEYAFSVYTVNNDRNSAGNDGVDEGYVVGAAVFHFEDFSNSIAPTDGTEVLNFSFTIDPDTDATQTRIRFLDGAVGEGQPVKNLITVSGITVLPELANSFVFIDGILQIVGDVSFFRGDSNQDQRLDVADGIHILNHLFGQGSAPTCMDAADADDNGTVNIADPVAVFGHLFSGTALAQPLFPVCGIDLTPDTLPKCEPGGGGAPCT